MRKNDWLLVTAAAIDNWLCVILGQHLIGQMSLSTLYMCVVCLHSMVLPLLALEGVSVNLQ